MSTVDTKEKKKDEVFSINIIYNNSENLKELSNDETFSNLVLEKALEAIEKAIKNKKNKCDLFNIKNLSLIVEIDKKQYKSALLTISEYYSNIEDYDTCIKIQNLINEYI
jgi:hypothetical protein